VGVGLEDTFNRLEQRLGFQHHAGATTERIVIHGPMGVTGEVAGIDERDFQHPLLLRYADRAAIKRPPEILRKQGYDMNPHR